MYHKFRNSIFQICLHPINSHCTSYLPPSSMLSSGAGTSKEIPLQESSLSLHAILITLSFSFFEVSYSIEKFHSILFIKVDMSSNTSISSGDSDVFFVEHISNEPSPRQNNSPNILSSTEISHTQRARMPSVSSIASPERQSLTIHDESNEPAMP